MCTSTPATGTPVTPPVDLDELAALVGRCKSLALTLQLVVTGSGLPDGPEREGICYDLAALIEDHTGRAERLVAALM